MLPNPFKRKEENPEERAIKEQREHETNTGLLLQQTSPEEINLIERREALIQLNQWQQDRSSTMQKIFLKLSGYEIDKDNRLIPSKWDKGYCSLIGAHKLVNFIETLDHNVMLANWEEKTLFRTMREGIAHPLRNFIFLNHQELGIDFSKAEYVLLLIVNSVEPNFWRGWNDGERRKDREMIKVSELRNNSYQEKRKGIFGMDA